MSSRIPGRARLLPEEINTDSDRDRWFTADQARDYGFIDHVITGTSQVQVGN